MILARKAVGVTNQSQIIDDGYDPTDGDGYYAKINGDTIDNVIQQVLLLCGDVNTDTSKGGISTDGFKLVSEGLNYKYYISDKAYDIYAKYQNNTQSKPDCTVTTNDNTNPKGFLTTDGGVVPNHTTTLIDMGVKHIYIESATDPVFAYICSGDWSNQYTGDFPGVRLTDKVTKTDKNGTSHTLYTVNIPASGALMMVLSDGTQDLTKPDKPGYNQTVDIGPINDNDIYLKFTLGNRTSDQYGKIASYDNTTTSFTDSEEKDVINTNFKVGTHTVYFKNSVGWTQPYVWAWKGNTHYVLADAEPGDKMTKVEGTTDVWQYTYTGDNTGYPEGVVFSDSRNPQSVNLTFKDNDIYELDINRVTSGDDYGKNPLKNSTTADESMQFLTFLYGREISSNKISTICLPFELSQAQLTAMSLKAYSFDHEYGRELFFNRVSYIQARKPYLIIYTGDNSANIFNSRIISNMTWTAQTDDATNEFSDTGASSTSQWTFKGTLHNTKKKTDETTTYFGYADASKQFTQVTTGFTATIPATVCWFELPTSVVNTWSQTSTTEEQPSQARRMNVILSDGATTSIVLIPVELGGLNPNAPIYNLAGQRVTKAYKGVVIQGDKKYISK